MCRGVVGRTVVQLSEGSEPEVFWAALGGKAEYAKCRPGDPVPREARLFHILGFGNKVEEVYHFEQEDLLEEDCFVLDRYTEVFVWVGSQATAQERENAEKVPVGVLPLYLRNIVLCLLSSLFTLVFLSVYLHLFCWLRVHNTVLILILSVISYSISL